jgi:hypothetical protein
MHLPPCANICGSDEAMLSGLVYNYARPPQGPLDPGGGPPGDLSADCEARAEDTNHLKREVERSCRAQPSA